MEKIKLAIVYQVIFHYRVPFYQEIENDETLNSILIHGNGVKGTKLQNTKHTLQRTKKIFSSKVSFKQGNQKKYFSFFPFLFFVLIRVNPKIILLEGSSSILNNISAILYAKLFRKKVIFWSLGKVKNKELSPMRQKIDKLILRIEKSADAIFTYSTIGEEYFLSRGIKKEKIFKGVNVIDTRKILQQTPAKNAKNPNEFRILFIGSIIPVKRLELLIDAFLKLQSVHNNIYLDIIGSGADYFDELKSKYEGTSENLIFHGRITENLDTYYFRSDVFVLPGLGGLAISESMAYGLPVICTTADGTERDLIENGESGIIIEDMNFDTLYKQLETLYSNPEMLEKMSSNSRHRIQNKYSFENYYKVFKECVKYVHES